MAKRRRIKSRKQTPVPETNDAAGKSGRGTTANRRNNDLSRNKQSELAHGKSKANLDPISIAAGLFAGAMVYISYYPSDSISVEQGDALWLALLALATATICMGFGFSRQQWQQSSKAERVLTLVPWGLAGWMMLAAWVASTTGDLRMATNEGWLWVTAAALFTSARVLCQSLAVRRALTTLAITCVFGVAVHGLHQYFVSLPANRAEYQRNPDRILDLAGVEAPAGSAERMVFENRLFDGGPTGTFALANSLAAALLVGVLAGVGLIRWRYRSLAPIEWFSVASLVLICGGSLMAARSRSATLAMLIGISIVIVAASLKGRNKRLLYIGASTAFALGITTVVILATTGNREWFEQAPQSLAFRFQYWRSTWQLALDHPWLGAGPGNFQSIYEQYREASAHEQIAEPHNLFIETLASGGFVGLGLLSTLLIAGGIRVAGSTDRTAVDDRTTTDLRLAGSSALSEDRDRWVWLGAGLSFAMIWLLGLASRQPPDLEASLWVVPLSLAAGYLLWQVISQLSGEAIDQLWIVILIAIGIHLMAAGGWTVPGVAIAFWLGGGLLTRIGSALGEAESQATHRPPKRQLVALCIGVLLMGSVYGMSIRPVQQKRRLMASAIHLQQPQQRREVLEQAVAADPWSSEAVLWLADWYRWALILRGDTPALREPWSRWLEVAKERAGEAPSVYRMIGSQQLHVYQRYGNPADLEAAAKTFEKAVQWSPSNQWLMAQMALIAQAKGEPDAAQALSQRAWELSELGGNIERALSRQQVQVVGDLGVAAENGPILKPAAVLLPRQ